MRRVYLEVLFKRTNIIKSFEATGTSFYDGLYKCYLLLNEFNIDEEEYDVLYILKV